MIIVDSSVWVDHLRKGDSEVAERLTAGDVLTHPLIVEEIACGYLTHRDEIIGLLEALPMAPVATHKEVIDLIARERLFGLGIGAIDAQLLASTRLAKARIWSRDKALVRVAVKLGIATP